MATPSTTLNQRYKKWSRILLLLFFIGIFTVAAIFWSLSMGELPTLTQLENPKSELSSTVYAADGSELGRYYIQNRVAVQYADLNPYLVDALLATEDERYHQHSGIDWWGLARAVGRLGKDGGASTITQQLARQIFTGAAAKSAPARVKQKAKEWIIATRLERNYTKEEIMAMYFNIFEYTYGAFGVEAAAEIYFGKNQSDLTKDEAAVLVGMFKNPSFYNPKRFPERSKKRREVVLKQMEKAGRITQVEYDSLRMKPLKVVMKSQTHIDGPAPYFRMELRKEIHRILKNPDIVNSDGEKYDVNRDGLKIFTTIDPKIQALAETSAWEHMKQLQKTYNGVWKNRDEWTHKENIGEEDETPPEELESRARRLKKFIRESDRYASIRATILEPTLEEIGEAYDDWEITERDIDRLIMEKKDGDVISYLKRTRSIGQTLEGRYRKILKDDANWDKLTKAYGRLDNAVDAAFTKPVKMKVFAYNTDGEVDTTMSPLDSIKYHKSILQIGSMAVDPKTGYVKAWVGGVNHKWFPFDHVQTRRQVGSTFKPFIYATAIAQQGISPCYRVADLPQTIRVGESGFNLLDDWAPGNANGEFTGEYLTLMDALKKSKNTVSVYLMKQLGDTDPVRGLVHNMGIDSSARYSNGRFIVPESPSIALGATDLSVEEMAGAYTTWANNGIYVKPVIVRRIEDKNGKVLFQAIPEERNALDPISNYTMVRMLQHAGQSGYYFGGLSVEYGGKTGTTNDYVDGWYMGVTPNLIVGTWVGGDERYIRFLTLTNGQGGRMARPYFASLIKKIEENAEEIGWEKGAKFNVPPGASRIEFDCDNVPFEYTPNGGFSTIDSTGAQVGSEGNGAFGSDPFGNDPFGSDGFDDEADDPFADDPFGDEVTAPIDTTAVKVDTLINQ
ncbi:MAG: transglycosylase domain-containing protein [Saprospiraceae bacterium]